MPGFTPESSITIWDLQKPFLMVCFFFSFIVPFGAYSTIIITTADDTTVAEVEAATIIRVIQQLL